MTANFASNGGPGHAEVFGSAINELEDPGKIDAVHQSGSRFVRRDAYLFQILPQTTIQQYLADMATGTGVADPNNWDWSKYGWVDEYHNRGMKIMLILGYTTRWLGYGVGDEARDFDSPPKGPDGFRVYEDAVKKIYQRFRGKVDMVEVWNEPNIGFLDVSFPDHVDGYPDSSPGRLAAYKEIYYHASKAIREVDQTIPIGGPALSNQSLTQELPPPALPGVAHWVRDMFADPRLYPNIDFLSYHTYNDYGSFRDEVVATWKQAARDAGKGADFPVYVTEWNSNASFGPPPLPENASHPHSISYTANRLTHFYEQHANGTNYYADNDESLVPAFFGVHRNGMLAPKARAYRLLSQDLGLGAGPGTVRPISFAAPVSNAGAATTANGEHVAWVVNDGAAQIEVDLNLTGLGGITSTQAHIFEARPDQSAVSPKASMTLAVSGGSATVRFAAPAKSVVGVRLTSYPIADTDNLAASAVVSPSTVSREHPHLDGQKVVDGVIGIWGAGEWASNGELKPTIRLEWPSPRTVGRVVLYDRSNTTDKVANGRLVFSDGTAVPVPALPDDSTGKAVSFAPRSVTSVVVELSGSGANVGLSELQVFAGTNAAPDGTVTTSTGASSHVKAIDGIAGTAGEWTSTETDPWIRIGWVNSQTIDSVVLHDRPDTASNANGGTLTFSDGSSVLVTGIPADGSAKVVSFAAKTVTWVRFATSGGSGTNVGLAELRVMRSGNLASSAAATATSTSRDDPTLTPDKATDGVINQWFAGEWASHRELAPRIRLTWSTPQVIDQVVLYDRNNLTDHTIAGTLSFSAGGSVAVSGMDDTGVGKVVTFSPRTVAWVEFAVSSRQGTFNAGLSEFEVFFTGSVQVRRHESFSQPDQFWRHSSDVGRVDLPTAAPADDFRFRLVPGLADPNALTFESVNTGKYLRHQDGQIRLHAYEDTALFRADATFSQVPGLANPSGWFSYRSQNHPDHHIWRDSQGFLWIARISGAQASADATFRPVT